MNDATCEKCQTTAGTPHSFHYGKAAEPPSTDPPSTYRAPMYGNLYSTWTEHYDVGGVDAAVLCNRCLARARTRHAFRLLRTWAREPLVMVLYILWAAGVVVFAWPGEWTHAALWFGAGVLATAGAFTAIYVWLSNEEFAQRAAVELHEKQLRDAGWDAFWVDREFTGLTPH